MSKFISIIDETHKRNVSLSIDSKGEIHLLGVLYHNTKLNINIEEAKSLITLLQDIIQGKQ